MKFEYRSILPHHITGRWRWMPIVEVTLSGPKGERRALALIDSGAEYCFVNRNYADILGIDLEVKESIRVYGVIGTSATKSTPLATLKVHLEGVGTTKVVAGFIDSDAVNVILGQIDFFDNHHIDFKKFNKVFDITKIK